MTIDTTGGLRSVLAVGFARLQQAPIGLLMLAADEMDLRQRIEDGAGRLPHELRGLRTSRSAVERLFCAIEAAEADANLPERGERHAQAVRRAALLLQFHAALGQRQRLVVPVLHQRDVRLVPQTVASTSPASTSTARRSAWPSAAIASSRRPSWASVTPERMHHRQVAPVADGVQGRAACVKCSRTMAVSPTCR